MYNNMFYIHHIKLSYLVKYTANLLKAKTGLPHTQGIQGNSGNLQVEENLREF